MILGLLRGTGFFTSSVRHSNSIKTPRRSFDLHLRTSTNAILFVNAMLHQTYELQSSTDDGAAINGDVADWQADFQDLLEAEADTYSVFNVLYLTGRSIDDALEESVSGELFLFITTCELRDESKNGMRRVLYRDNWCVGPCPGACA